MADWNKDYLLPMDEIVVMARDLAGSQRDDCPYEWLDPLGNPGLEATRQEIEIQDNGDVFWVYAYRWSQPPPNSPEFVAPGSAPAFASESCTRCSGEGAGSNSENICGTVSSQGVTSQLPGYSVHLASNWLIDRIARKDSSGEGELASEIAMKALFEDTNNWSCNNKPRKHGVTTGTKVRFIRSIQGAQSGWGTVRIEKAYDTLYETEYEMRVHDLPAAVNGVTISMIQVHHDSIIPAASLDPPFAAVWTPDLLPGEAVFDRVHQNKTAYPDAGLANIDPDVWTQVNVRNRAGIATYLLDDPRRGGIDADTQAPFYQDDAQVHGNFGRTWARVSCMQDGFDNDGGCLSDPESLALRFRRLWHRTFTTLGPANELASGNVLADNEYDAARTPYAAGFPVEQASGSSCGGGGTPCKPVLNAATTGEGETDLSNSPSSVPVGCAPSSIMGYGITRQVNGGPEQLIAVVKSGTVFRDVLTRGGLPHTYRGYSIARGGVSSEKTTPVTVTPNDVTPPPAPTLGAMPIDLGAVLDFEACVGRGVSGANIYVSTSSGGPYTKVNATPIAASGATHFTVTGLQNNMTYYVVAKLIDHAGNSSAYSAEVSVTPHP
jgi:hypothetical protein